MQHASLLDPVRPNPLRHELSFTRRKPRSQAFRARVSRQGHFHAQKCSEYLLDFHKRHGSLLGMRQSPGTGFDPQDSLGTPGQHPVNPVILSKRSAFAPRITVFAN
jgi:hypothetical protein